MIEQVKNSLFWKWAEYILYFFIGTFPFITYSSFLYTGTSTRSINLTLIVSLLAVGFAIWSFRKSSTVSIPKSPILIALAAYFVCLIISGIAGLSFGTSFWSVATRTTGIWYFACLGFFLYLLLGIFADRTKHHRLILLVIISTALYSICTFLGYEGLGWIFKNGVIDGFTFGNSTFAAMYIFGAFLLSIYYYIQAETKKWWMYILPVALLINPYILNRNIWFGDFSGGIVGEARATAYVIFFSIISLGIFWLISKIKKSEVKSKVVYGIFGISILVMIVGTFSLFSPDGIVRKIYLSQGTGARPLVWEMSEKVIAQRPILGWGTDNFERVFEVNYDNRLLQDEYGNEAWFDRAHNVFADQLVDNGWLGLIVYLLVYIVTILCLIFTALRSDDKEDRTLSAILIIYFSLHILELQTAFDTSISYVMMMIMAASAIILFDRTYSKIRGKNTLLVLGKFMKYGVGVFLILFFGWTFIVGWWSFVQAQITNGSIRKVGSSEKRIPMYPSLFGSNIDQHAFLWRTFTDFQRGIAENLAIINNPQKAENLKKELVIMENEYRKYVNEHPEHFRARLNLADVLIYSRLLEVDKLEEAQTVLDAAIKQVPQSPQPYWMKAVAYIYMRKFDLAREYAKKAFDLNPKVTQSQDVIRYVEDSIKTFPNIELYFFRQI